MFADLKFALRQLAKSPCFTAVAVLSLALGIGANTAIFSLVDDVLLKSLPVQRPEELVLFRWVAGERTLFHGLSGSVTKDPATGLKSSTSLSYFIFERLRDQADAFSEVFAFADRRSLPVSIDSQPELARGQCVSGNYFRGLGLTALRGRLLTTEDDRTGATPVAVISERFWQRRFEGSDSAIGKTIRINGVAITIVGVTPRGFDGALEIGRAPDLTLPFALNPQVSDGVDFFRQPLNWRLNIMARLKPGLTAAQAHARSEPILMQAARDAWLAGEPGKPSESLAGRDVPRLRLEPGGQGLMDTRRDYERPLLILVIIVSLVLAIACANVANLLLARAATRRREIAVRLSVGASRGRLIRQLLAESLVLALFGGALGILFAFWGRDALVQLRSYGGSATLELNLRVLAFTLGASVLTSLLFGLAPAWRATAVDLNAELKGATAGATGRARFTLRSGLMIVQVALSVVLLVGAGLFLRTLHNLRAVNLGFARAQLLVFNVNPPVNRFRVPQRADYLHRLVERLSRLPAVKSVAVSIDPVLSGNTRVGSINLDSSSQPSGEIKGEAGVTIVGAKYFPTLQIPVPRGRDFSERDTAGQPRAAVVNEAFARKFFPDSTPIGHTVSFGFSHQRPTEIVGVARDARYVDLRKPIEPTIYLAIDQNIEDAGSAHFILRTAGDPRPLAAAVSAAVHEVDPDLPLTALRTEEEQVDQLLSEERLFATLSAFLGGVALLLTCIGLYGLLAHHVATRTREIGIRMALGAQLHKVVTLVLGEGLRLAALGVALGLTASLALSRFVSSMLFNLPPNDPATLAGVSTLLVAVAIGACFVPARRAARVDPMVALRCE